MAILGVSFVAVLCGAFYLLSAPPQPAAAAPASPAIVKSTITEISAVSPDTLPFAEPIESGSGTPDAAVSAPVQPLKPQPVAATAPGNFMHYDGKLISVAETIPSEDGNGNALAVDVVPEPAAASLPAVETASGLSTEEELFRAKWGWAATDDIKTSAAQETTTAAK